MKTMILGANGLCGISLTHLLKGQELILIDGDEESNPPIIKVNVEIKDLWHILRSFHMQKGDILIDLAPGLDKIGLMQLADSVGVSVINATCCEQDRGSLSLIDLLDDKLLLARYKWQVPHIVDGGMNPGNINALLASLVEKYGKPTDVTEWEVDSTIPYKWDGEGFATWSPEEFASEMCDEATWEVDGKNILFADGSPIDNLYDMGEGNVGALCEHEELLKWGWMYGCKARYLYGYPSKTMDAIKKTIKEGLELSLCRKMKGRVPDGGDIIGVRAEFKRGTKSAQLSIQNKDPRVPELSNATSYLVACGVVCAIEMLKQGGMPGLHWPDEYGTRWINVLRQRKLCEVKLD